ncbi:uncharacterized protein LOC144115626 isoform X3 [Amblyomma americanum]
MYFELILRTRNLDVPRDGWIANKCHLMLDAGMSWEQADVDRPAVLRAVLRHQRATALAWPLVALARSRTPDLAMASQWDQKQAHRVPHHPDL